MLYIGLANIILSLTLYFVFRYKNPFSRHRDATRLACSLDCAIGIILLLLPLL